MMDHNRAPQNKINWIIIVGLAVGAVLREPLTDLIYFITGYEPVQSD